MARKRNILIGGGAVLAAILAVAGLAFEPWLLFIDETVDEPEDASVLVKTTEVPEPSASVATRVELASAEFIDAEHGTSGKATVFRRSDGTRFLRLSDLDTSNGPDLHVWITDQASGGECAGCRDSWGIYDDGEYLALGPLKGNKGNQNYEIPRRADLSGMTSVVIWCDRFNVAFGTADITPVA